MSVSTGIDLSPSHSLRDIDRKEIKIFLLALKLHIYDIYIFRTTKYVLKIQYLILKGIQMSFYSNRNTFKE